VIPDSYPSLALARGGGCEQQAKLAISLISIFKFVCPTVGDERFHAHDGPAGKLILCKADADKTEEIGDNCSGRQVDYDPDAVAGGIGQYMVFLKVRDVYIGLRKAAITQNRFNRGANLGIRRSVAGNPASLPAGRHQFLPGHKDQTELNHRRQQDKEDGHDEQEFHDDYPGAGSATGVGCDAHVRDALS
jgi:hypothetical protein